MKKEVIAKMQCSECKDINYYTHKNNKANKTKLELKKYCPRCQKHTTHKQMKK
jgi:large subunit ribosomal protein L33